MEKKISDIVGQEVICPLDEKQKIKISSAKDSFRGLVQVKFNAKRLFVKARIAAVLPEFDYNSRVSVLNSRWCNVGEIGKLEVAPNCCSGFHKSALDWDLFKKK